MTRLKDHNRVRVVASREVRRGARALPDPEHRMAPRISDVDLPAPTRRYFELRMDNMWRERIASGEWKVVDDDEH